MLFLFSFNRQKHEEIMCENYRVVCKYCIQMIPRKDIEHHESTTCDEVPTKCEFQAIGCNHDKVRMFGLIYNFMSAVVDA